MLDDEIRCDLERLNREHQWLKAVSAKYPDLCVYEYGDRKLYCSRSVNGDVDEFHQTSVIDEGLYHDVNMEANFAVTCYRNEDGGRVHSWPPMFVIGRIARSGPGNFKHLLYECWRRQLEDAGIAALIIDAIAATNASRTVEREPCTWRDGDVLYGLWTTEDREGEVIGAFRLHQRVQHDVFTVIAARANEFGISFSNHDGGFTIGSAHDLQSFVDDTIVFLRERNEDGIPSTKEEDRVAA